jgi:hypothetical protein
MKNLLIFFIILFFTLWTLGESAFLSLSPFCIGRPAVKGKRCESDKCAVCLESWEESSNVPVETLCCGHLLHQRCADACRDVDGRCPLCRQVIWRQSRKEGWKLLNKKKRMLEKEIQHHIEWMHNQKFRNSMCVTSI